MTNEIVIFISGILVGVYLGMLFAMYLVGKGNK